MSDSAFSEVVPGSEESNPESVDAPSKSSTASGSKTDERQDLYKILVIGDYAVGKTSLINRYTSGYFTPNYKLTIGVDFALKNIPQTANHPALTLQLWDIAGHERFGSMTHTYFKYAVAAVIVFDVQRPATFDAVLKWKEDVDAKATLQDGSPIPCILLANKIDALAGAASPYTDKTAMDEFASQHGFAAWFATSALSNAGINEAMEKVSCVVADVAAKNNVPERPSDVITPTSDDTSGQEPKKEEKKKGCCN